jgi:hypothetical protein
MSTQQNTRRHRILAAVLAAAITASPISLAPSAAAHGVVEPQEVCLGPEVAGGVCNSRAAHPIPGHLTERWRLDPHGSRHRKMEIAQWREEQAALREGINSNSGSDSGTAPTTTNEDAGPAGGTVQHPTQTGASQPNSNGESDQ